MTANNSLNTAQNPKSRNENDSQYQQQQQRRSSTTSSGGKRKKRQRLDPSTSRVVVVGAGLAGLSAALSLKRAGFSNVRVYERDESLEHQKEGYGLTLTYNPKGPLADLGVLETVAQCDCPSRSHYLFRQEDSSKLAVPMGYFGNAFVDGPLLRGYGQRGNLRVPRKVLRKILHDALLEKGNLSEKSIPQSTADPGNLPTPTVHWGQSLVDFKWDESTQKYHVRFAPSSDRTSSKTTTVVTDLLIAADGIRSTVLQQLYRQKLENKHQQQESTLTNTDKMNAALPKQIPNIREFPECYGLKPMGVRLILGIADGINHPLLRERGFYTVDTHGHRLFTMPYRSNRFDANDDNGHPKSQNRIMWQLSFATPGNPKTLDAASLRKYVLDTFETWHPPALELVQSTPPEGIWGTDLMDREPREVYEELVVGNGRKCSGPILQPRLAICGDALHSMSCFKGQGANQALADGPLLAKFLSKSSIDAALTNWWRETLNRTVPVVEASRKAATDWHTSNTILDTNQESHQEYHGFAGVKASAVPLLIQVLRDRKIGPHLGDKLDETIRKVIDEHEWFDDCDSSDANVRYTHEQPLDPDLCDKILDLAANGDTQGLRRLSLPSSSSGGNAHRQACRAMIQSRDSQGRSSLHLAATGNHTHTCKWLLTELRILEQWNTDSIHSDPGSDSIHNIKDTVGKTALDYALETGDKELIRIFEVVVRENNSVS